jgi:3-isopropylmalate/(R)-2-methylmalate dehydratase small subunit
MYIHGRAWKYGDNVNTDVIFPGKYTYTVTERAEIARHALEDLDPAFAANVQPGDVIVGGRNFGCGSSREQAATCLVYNGVGAVVAVSISRIFYRNALNNGLLAIVCPDAAQAIQPGERVDHQHGAPRDPLRRGRVHLSATQRQRHGHRGRGRTGGICQNAAGHAMKLPRGLLGLAHLGYDGVRATFSPVAPAVRIMLVDGDRTLLVYHSYALLVLSRRRHQAGGVAGGSGQAGGLRRDRRHRARGAVAAGRLPDESP